MGTRQILIVAGEASGDLHGARLLDHLTRARPETRAFGMGGEQLVAAGFERTNNYTEISVVGIKEVLRVLSRARKIFDHLLAEVERRQATTAVLIDFPEFNLRLAKALARRGVKVIYYISPQLWAWRRRRVSIVRKYVDRMLVLFPFEVEFYESHGVKAVHVGHPLVDEVPQLPHIWDSVTGTGEPCRISLLPGSRTSELAALLPILLAAAQRIAVEIPVRFSLIRARSLTDEMLAAALGDADELDLEIVTENRFETLASSHLALCTSGTATLEVGLCGTPMLVVYKIGWATYLMGRLLVRLPFVSLVNLLLGREVVPELLQNDCTPELVAARALSLLGDHDRARQTHSELGELRRALGFGGASRRAAQEIAALLPEQ